MKYLFWNTHNERINPYVEEIIAHYSCDIIALCEYSDNPMELIVNLSKKTINMFYIDTLACERIHIFGRFSPYKIEHCGDDPYYTIKKIPHESLGMHLVAFVHFPSKLHRSQEAFNSRKAEKLVIDILAAEQRWQTNKTLIVGDFNMNPFEYGIVSASCLHGVISRNVAKNNSRSILKESFSMFYNPMWNLLGDFSDPPGTYFYNNSDYVCYFWNIFDQVLLRPSLLNNFNNHSLKIITFTGANSLVSNTDGRPSVSDHLPIYFEIS